MPDGRAWLAIVVSAVFVAVMNGLLARASSRGDISIVGAVFALSPVFTVIPDAVLSGTLPSPLGWLGLALSVTGTVSLSGGAGVVGRLRALFARRDALDALGAAILLGHRRLDRPLGRAGPGAADLPAVLARRDRRAGRHVSPLATTPAGVRAGFRPATS